MLQSPWLLHLYKVMHMAKHCKASRCIGVQSADLS